MKNRIGEKNNYYYAIVDAVCYWLGYQFKIGRDKLIHEASLRYPIADTITATGVKINRIVLEQLHPIFKHKKIDLVIFDENIEEPETEKDDTNLKEVFEFKIAKKKTSEKDSDEHQRIFDDIVRLAYYHLWKDKKCCFLICGEYEEFKTYFVGQKSPVIPKDGINKAIERKREGPNKFEEWKPDGLYKDWFGFKINEIKEIEFNKKDDDMWGLKLFQENYHIREKAMQTFSDTIKIRTKCLAITPPGLENIRTHAAGIWQVEAVK